MCIRDRCNTTKFDYAKLTFHKRSISCLACTKCFGRRYQKLTTIKRLVYGNTGKWPSGSGEDKARYAGKAQVLPPEWTVALDLYQETLTSVVDDMLTKYKNGDEEMRQYILQVNGVETPEQLDAVLNKLLYQAGLQSIELTDSP